MEIVTRPVHPHNICEGCLSRDRILAIITNDEIKEVYCTIIPEKLENPARLVLCWECIANIQRYIQFRRQCARAHDMMIKYMILPPHIKSLSKLSRSKVKHITLINNQILASNDTENYFTNNDFTTKSQNDDISARNLASVDYDDKNDIIYKSEQDIAFIKVEESGVNEDDEYDGDEVDERPQDVGDKNYGPIIECNYEKVINNVKKNKKEEVFDESDEEPLNIKKNKTATKLNKKKQNNEIPKQEKASRKKREKPPGVISNSRVNKKLEQLNVAPGQIEMVLLSWDEVEQERQQALLSVVFTRHEYRCRLCVVGFNHKFKLDNHMKKHDPCSGSMVCSTCEVRCKDSHALSAHRRRHRLRWRCSTCGCSWSRASVAADHAAREHGGQTPQHTCALCGHHATSLGKLRNHLKNHGERQKCHLCEKTFRDRTSLRTHLFIHKGEKEYSCPKCEKKFLFKKAMEVHLITHDASAHLYCYQCDMTFKNTMSYTQHMKYSLKHIDPAKLKYACNLCDKKFAKATRLEEHKLAVHIKATPIKCTVPECNFACSSRAVLRTHTRMSHGSARSLRNHVCHTCGKRYTTKKTLEGHIRSHTGERPFKCNICPSTFGYEAALYNHNKLVHLKGKITRRPAQQSVQEPQPSTGLSLAHNTEV